MREVDRRAYIIEGTQGSGKTTAAEHMAGKGCQKFRGIPSGDDLAINREAENWTESKAILELAANPENGSISVMDRSIWSLVVHNAMRYPEHRFLIYNLGKNMFRRGIDGQTNYAIIFLVTDPETSFRREDSHSIHSHQSIEKVQEEAQTYQWLMDNLEQDGFNVIRIQNDCIAKEDFLDLVEQAVKAPI